MDYMEEDQVLILKGCTTDEFNEFWKHYFDLTRDYSQIKMDLSSNDQIMEEAVRYGWGIRILNGIRETLISFIISANNNITRIKGIIEKLSENSESKFPGKVMKVPLLFLSFAYPGPCRRGGSESLRLRL